VGGNHNNGVISSAIADLKTVGILPEHVELRQIKYLNNLIEQDHRFIKRYLEHFSLLI
jgi:transposase-like protein